MLATAYETGLSGPGRLHDLFVAVEAVTPGEYKEFGEDVEIRYGFAPSPFGDCLIAVTGRAETGDLRLGSGARGGVKWLREA